MVRKNQDLLQEIAQVKIDEIATVASSMTIRGSWIRYIRRALQMNQKDLAEKAQLTVSAVTQAESRELDRKLNLKTLHKLANAMDCQLVYAIIPNQRLETQIENAITAKATSILEKVSTHMALEDQESKREYSNRLKSLKSEIRNSGKFW